MLGGLSPFIFKMVKDIFFQAMEKDGCFDGFLKGSDAEEILMKAKQLKVKPQGKLF